MLNRNLSGENWFQFKKNLMSLYPRISCSELEKTNGSLHKIKELIISKCSGPVSETTLEKIILSLTSKHDFFRDDELSMRVLNPSLEKISFNNYL